VTFISGKNYHLLLNSKLKIYVPFVIFELNNEKIV